MKATKKTHKTPKSKYVTEPIPKADLQAMAWEESPEGYSIIHDKILDQTRWSVIHELVFTKGTKAYMTTYSVGATEYQSEDPFEHSPDMIECTVVLPMQVTITEYKPLLAGDTNADVQ